MPVFPALTALRGLAAWWVVLYHFREALPAGGLLQRVAGGGHLAVDVFFVLSGFVIALTHGRDFHRLDAATTARFWGLRLARIYPLHLAMLLAFLSVPLAITLASSQGAPPDGFRFGYFAQSLLLVQNWGFTDELLWNIPAWSISTELAAYLLFPLLAWGVSRCLHGLLPCLLALAAVLAALAAIFWFGGVASIGDDIPRLGLPRCLLEFIAGMLLQRIWQARPDHDARARFGGILALLAIVALSLDLAPDYVLVPAASCGVILALLQPPRWLAALADNAVLQWLGRISYATYLAHYLVKVWVKFLLVHPAIPDAVVMPAYLGATLLASWLLHEAVERPWQRRGRAWLAQGRATRLAVPG